MCYPTHMLSNSVEQRIYLFMEVLAIRKVQDTSGSFKKQKKRII